MEANQNGPIVLLTDFGDTDAFAGILKGVIAGINPDAAVIDLTHGIAPQDIGRGAFVLATSYEYFPKGSIFCVVVDPGVGSKRKAICIRTEGYVFVGPDNGILWEAATENGIVQIIHLDQPAFFLDGISATFHGRDIFAPVCARISKGIEDFSILGTEMAACTQFSFPDIKTRGKTVELTVLYVDRFGNITLNIKQDQFAALVKDRPFVLTINDFYINRQYPAYAAAADDELCIIASSDAYMEICLKNSSAADLIKPGFSNKAVLDIITEVA